AETRSALGAGRAPVAAPARADAWVPPATSGGVEEVGRVPAPAARVDAASRRSPTAVPPGSPSRPVTAASPGPTAAAGATAATAAAVSAAPATAVGVAAAAAAPVAAAGEGWTSFVAAARARGSIRLSQFVAGSRPLEESAERLHIGVANELAAEMLRA